MTAVLERIVAIIAPHYCFICSKEDNVICLACLSSLFPGLDSVCVFCAGRTQDYAPCGACRPAVALERVWAAAEYTGLVSELIGVYKFERVVAAYKPLAQALEATISYLPSDTCLVPIPTAPRRIRVRGYDQAVLLAKELSRMRNLNFYPALTRSLNLRQVGADRAQRAEQAENIFSVSKPVMGKKVLLVDDVCTTGAMLKAAARALQQAGASNVQAAVIAWAPPKQNSPL